MNTRKYIKIILLLIPVLLMVFQSCKHDDLEIEKENENFRTAADFIKNNYEMTLFYAAVEKSGLLEKLKTTGPFTLLVPNDEAFKAVGIQRPSDLDKMNPDSLKGLVERHILNERLLFDDVPHNGVDVRYLTMAGTEVFASMAGYAVGNSDFPTNDLYFDGSTVIKKDVPLANGTLHMLNKVMKNNPKSTVQDWLVKRPQYRIFVAGLKKFGLWDKLASSGPYTVFAIRNEFFEAAEITEASIQAMNPQEYYGSRLFGAYVLEKKHFFLSDFEVFKVNNKEQFMVRKVDGDNWVISLSTVSNFYTKAVTGTVGLRTAEQYPYDQYGVIQLPVPGLTDNLCNNGIVHDAQGLLLMPEQALKN
ncbi:fasciclin domain-containing protein [Pedobacter gandavensis]|uniref:fasciclin domain-containing protein n=1 Tax=Pedobacter gandavensis TaxID=2679963 RepID=UPI0029317FA9|nr:fasciclin domain-containing protein [Pedobacter gandavensis]